MTEATPSTLFRERLALLTELQKLTRNAPYSSALRLKLADAYRGLGYPDLAVGDAYKALLLVDEVVQGGEYYHQALRAARDDVASCNLFEPDHIECCCSSQPALDSTDDQLALRAKTCWSKSAYGIIISGLLDCGCWRSAYDYSSRALNAFPENADFLALSDRVKKQLHSYFESKGETLKEINIDEYPEKGLVRREHYPWSNHEPDRFSAESLKFLNQEMDKTAPKLEVRVAELPLLSSTSPSETGPGNDGVRYVKQLGLFAREDIPPGQEVLKEKSLLTAISRLHEIYCDACSVQLPSGGDLANDSDFENPIISCDECDEVFFCSEECYDLAQESYHPCLCGVDTEQKVAASEAADSLYFLLLVRALALAEYQELHPLDLKEVCYIWGDYHGLDLEHVWQADQRGQLCDPFASVPRTLPFSFKSNVLMPLHILEKMDINIFEQSHRYNTWVFNTLYAKFRGTASAKQGLDGRPEIGAVHPMWCLANHSCDPNVAWEWQGSIKFWTRERLVEWKGRDPDLKPGVRQGQEVFSHYCDVRLSVKERREWAVGALGGECVCPRCVWEEEAEKKDRGGFA